MELPAIGCMLIDHAVELLCNSIRSFIAFYVPYEGDYFIYVLWHLMLVYGILGRFFPYSTS